MTTGLGHPGAVYGIVGDSPATRDVVRFMERYARAELPVLIIGATGTGKELVARGIHRLRGRRGEFVDVNCGALPSTMVEGLLFGHRRGAFTNAVEARRGLVELAGDGTLFLDELTSLPPEGQAALLRVLETGEVRRLGDEIKHRVRFDLVAAVQDDVGERIRAGRFRLDLYHRVAGAVIRLEPLARRPEDLLPLARHFAARLGRGLADSQVATVLRGYDWPGNVRELRAVVERAAALEEAPVIGAAALAEAIDVNMLPDQPATTERRAGFRREREEMEALCAAHDWQAERIAVALGVHRATLFRRLKRLGVSLRSLAAR